MNLGFNTRGNSQTSGRTTQAILGLGCLRNTKGSLTRKFKYCNARDRNVVFQCVFNQPIPTLTQCPEKISAGGIFTNNDELKDLRGVTIITGDLTIEGFDGQPDFSVFDCLTTIQGNLYIFDNNSLTNISGFLALKTVGGSFEIYNNNSLITIPGFSSLTSVGDYFAIDINNLLTNISGFSSLTSVGGFFIIIGNNSLITMPGFSSLTSIGSYFTITDNNSLENVSGFTSLISIGGFFEIYNNLMLTSISGFLALTPATGIGGNTTIGPNTIQLNVCLNTYTAILAATQGTFTPSPLPSFSTNPC